MSAMGLRAVTLIDTDQLPVYPIDRSDRLVIHYFTMWHHDRWLNSTMHLKASYEVQGVARALFDLAQRQTPPGTLPDDDEMLAKLLRLDLARWRDLCALPIGPLHNWSRCLCGNEVRLMHPVVTEVILDAMAKRETREVRKTERANDRRLERLQAGLAAAGLDREALGDETLVRRIDDWLLATHQGNRTQLVYQRAFEHAVRSRWVEAKDNTLISRR